MIDISIVVKIDNQKDNLKKCYETIINQLHENNEVFFWAEKDNRESKKIVTENKLKNVHYYMGSEKSIIKKLNGQYTFYLSSNDILENNSLYLVTQYINKKKPDLIITDYYIKIQNKKKLFKEQSFNIKNTEAINDDIEYAIRKKVSNKIVKTSLIKSSNSFSQYDNYTSIGKIDKPVLSSEYKETNKNNRMNFIKKDILIISIFALMFLCGLISISSVGGYFDEDSEKDILRMNIISYSEKLKIKRSYAQKLRDMGLRPITESVERDHGIAPYYAYALFFKLYNGYIESLLWHLYTYIICFVGVVCMYFILKHILKNKYLSLILSAVYFLSPRIFADSMYNNKDMILLTLLIISFYMLIRLLNKKSYTNAVILGIVCAFLCNVKVLGFYFIGIYAIAYYINIIVKKEFTVRNNLIGVVTVVSWFLCYIFITPAIWCGNDGFKLVEHIMWGLEQSSNFSRLKPVVRFEGIEYTRDINPLPWYYIPKMIAITSPIVIVALFTLSIILILTDICKILLKKQNIQDALMIEIIAIALFIIPFAIATFNKPNVYNGWRHFYFLYGIIIIIAAYALKYTQSKDNARKVINVILIINLIYYLIGNIINGVGGMTYYNFLVNNNKNLNYETDYYGVTTKSSIEKILKKYSDKKIYLFSRQGSSSSASLITSVNKLKKQYKKRIKVVETKKKYNQLKESGEFVLYFYNTNYNKKEEIKTMTPIYTYKSWYKIINGFYK